VLSLSWASGVQQLAEDVAGAPEVVAAMQTDLGTASSLSAKLEAAVERVEPHYASDSAVAQTFDKLRRASEALVKGRQVQAAISATNPDTVLTEVELTEPEAALYDRCAEQVTFRNGLQMRLLRTCTSCRMQRIVNPEYEKMQRMDTTVGSLLSLPSNALMALYRWRRGMPKFVCPRCQGMNSVDRTVVLCPRCGTMLAEPVLSVCCKCGYDFAHPDAPPAVPPAAPEKQPVPAPPAPPPPPSASAPPPAPRKVLAGKCAQCGNEFSVPLDRIPAGGLKAKCKGCGAALTIRRPAEKNPAPE